MIQDSTDPEASDCRDFPQLEPEAVPEIEPEIEVRQEVEPEAVQNAVQIEAEPPGLAEYFDVYTGQLRFFAEKLADEGIERGLIGPRELGRIWSRHLLNCAVLCAPDFLAQGTRVADVGSGAGLPGLVLAITRPDLSLTLVESMERRVEWLEECVQEIGLDNVQILHARAEKLHGKNHFDYVTGRAVGNLSKLIEWTAPLISRGGELVFLKGQSVDAEIQAAKDRYLFRKFKLRLPDIIEVSTPLTDELTRVVRIRK